MNYEKENLETLFIDKFELIVNNLVLENFSENDIIVFANTIKTFLKFYDIRQYVMMALYTKIKDLYNAATNLSQDHNSYRKLIKVILSINDYELTDVIETYLGKNKDPNLFLIFMEEKISKNLDTSNLEKMFISFFSIHQYSYENINKFLSLSKKDPIWLASILLAQNQNVSIRNYIRKLNEYDRGTLNKVVDLILNHKFQDTNEYVNIVVDFMLIDNAYTYQLLNNSLLNKIDFSIIKRYVLSNYRYNVELMCNICEYLSSISVKEMESFEQSFLECTDGTLIIRYAIKNKLSNKRHCLQQLVKIRDSRNEDNLVAFINMFPEYKSLLPML
jgi:hypothetical protein